MSVRHQTPPRRAVAARHAQPQDALPSGWAARLDTKSGRTYYVNQYTNETTWTKPPIPPPAATVAAPPGVAELSPLHTAGADHEEEGVGWRKQITAAEQDKDHVLQIGCCHLKLQIINCLFPCVPIYIKLANQAAAKSEEQSKEYATSKDKNKKMRLLVSAVMLLAEMFDMGSDWYVFFNQVRPNQARIEEAISEYFTIAYTVALVVTTFIGVITLIWRVGVLYCFSKKRTFSTDDELMMAALNELCSVFLLIFEDVPFFTMTTLLLYNTVEINQPTWQPLNDTSAVGDLEIYDGTQGSWHGAELPPSQAYTQFNNNTMEQCDYEKLSRALRDVGISYTFTAISFGFKCSSFREILRILTIKELLAKIADTTHKNKRLTTTLGKAHIETEVSHHKLNLESASKNEVVLVTHLAGV